MRKRNLLDPLWSRPLQEVLAAILIERDEPWYLSDLARRVRRTPSALVRPLKAALDAGIVRRWADGNRVYFARDERCPFLPELQGLLVKTIGLADVLRTALAPLSARIRLAFVYGSMASGSERSRSDVDLMVVGSITLGRLTPALVKAEQRLGRPVNAVNLSAAEFAERIAGRNYFLVSVLAKPKLFIVGDSDGLESFTGRRSGAATQSR